MPFQSDAQRKFLYSQHPDVAAEFASKTPKGANLPEHKKKSKKGGALQAAAARRMAKLKGQKGNGSN